MNRLKNVLIVLCVGAAGMATPAAFADSYHSRDGYGYDRHSERCEVRHHKGHGYGHERRVVVRHVYRAPVRERVVVHRGYDRARDYGHHREYRSATPMIMGGIVGGVLGNQVGKGRGRDAATVAGVLLGGSIGRDMGHQR